MKHFLPFLLAGSLCAQNPLPLGEAVRLALRQNKTMVLKCAPHRRVSTRLLPETPQTELFGIVHAQRQPRLCFWLPTDATSIRR